MIPSLAHKKDGNAMASDDFAYMSAASLARGIRERKFSPVEVMDATLARIEKRNPSLNAFVFLDAEGARKTARRAEVPLIAVNDVLYHHPDRRQLQDVLTCIREHLTIDAAGRRLAANAERYLKPPAEMARLFRAAPGRRLVVGRVEATPVGRRRVCSAAHLFPQFRHARP